MTPFSLLKTFSLHLGLAGVLLCNPASAGLFDDDEARKAILDLRTRQSQSDEQLRGEIASQARNSGEKIEQLQRNLLDQSNQIEQLRAELARERGKSEVAARDLAELQRRFKDLMAQWEDRLRKLEPQRVTVDGKEFLVAPEERKGFEDAVAFLRGGDFDRAAPALVAFLRRFPESGYVDSARYWLGNAQYGRKDYKEAVQTFRSFVAAAPDSPHAAEALLALGNCLVETKELKQARKTLEDLIKQYPKTEAAQAAKERLAALK
jgi:tol-pal system protein YbgF